MLVRAFIWVSQYTHSAWPCSVFLHYLLLMQNSLHSVEAIVNGLLCLVTCHYVSTWLSAMVGGHVGVTGSRTEGGRWCYVNEYYIPVSHKYATLLDVYKLLFSETQ